MTDKSITINNKVIKKGSIFASSWGYEQTNVNFYQVLRVRGTKTVEVKEIKACEKNTSDLTAIATPCPNEFLENAETLNRRIISIRDTIFIRIDSHENAYIHKDGKSYYVSYYC